MRDRRGVRDDTLIADLEAYVPEVMAVTGTPGLSLAFARHGELIREAAFGLADVTAAVPMTTRTAIRMASITKWYTAIAVLQLAEHGRLALDEPVERHLADVPVRNPLGRRPVTVYDLLTHRSGLATDTPTGDLVDPPPLPELLRATVSADRRPQYRDGEPCWTAPVGRRFQYSNLGVCVLGLLVERVNPERLSFAGYVTRHIFEPLGMRESAVVASAADAPAPIATGYARFGDILVPTPAVASATVPADGLISTPGDHIRLLLAAMGGRTPILSRASVRQMTRPHVRQLDVAVEEGAWYGLGTELANIGRRDGFFGHSGAYPFGWWSDSRAYPELDFALVVCTNKWDMLRWYNPASTIAPGLIAGFVARRLLNPRPVRAVRRGWAWKASYAAGMLLAERVNGVIGAPSLLTPAAIARLAGGAPARPGWDPAGFEAGARDLLAEHLTPAGIRDFLRSDRLGVPAEELETIALGLGGRGPLPVPMPYWADPNARVARSHAAAS